MKTQDLEDMLQFLAVCWIFFCVERCELSKHSASTQNLCLLACMSRHCLCLLLLIMYNFNFIDTLIIHPCPCQSPVDRPREKQLIKKPHTFKLDKLKPSHCTMCLILIRTIIRGISPLHFFIAQYLNFHFSLTFWDQLNMGNMCSRTQEKFMKELKVSSKGKSKVFPPITCEHEVLCHLSSDSE